MTHALPSSLSLPSALCCPEVFSSRFYENIRTMFSTLVRIWFLHVSKVFFFWGILSFFSFLSFFRMLILFHWFFLRFSLWTKPLQTVNSHYRNCHSSGKPLATIAYSSSQHHKQPCWQPHPRHSFMWQCNSRREKTKNQNEHVTTLTSLTSKSKKVEANLEKKEGLIIWLSSNFSPVIWKILKNASPAVLRSRSSWVVRTPRSAAPPLRSLEPKLFRDFWRSLKRKVF